MGSLQIRQRSVGSITALDVAGRMVLADSDSDTVLPDLVIKLADEGSQAFAIGLNDVTQMDTMGLCVLITSYLAVTKRKGRFVLVSPSARVRHLLAVTRLNTVLETYETEEAAVASLIAPKVGTGPS